MKRMNSLNTQDFQTFLDAWRNDMNRRDSGRRLDKFGRRLEKFIRWLFFDALDAVCEWLENPLVRFVFAAVLAALFVFGPQPLGGLLVFGWFALLALGLVAIIAPPLAVLIVVLSLTAAICVFLERFL